MQQALDEFVPKKLRPGFIFHAKDILNGYRKYGEIWSKEERLKLIDAVAAIPRQLNMAVSLGIVRRDFNFPLNNKIMKLHQLHHLTAFVGCIARANKYVRDWAKPSEVATIVAENVNEMRKFLKTALKMPINDFSLDHIRACPQLTIN